MASSKPFWATSALFVSTALLTIHSAQALEPSGNNVADAFLSLLEAEQGTVESYGNVSVDGDIVSINNIRLVDSGVEKVTITIDKTDLQGGETLPNGRLKVDTLSMDKLVLISEENGGMGIESFKATELVLPTPEEIAANDPAASNPAYKTLDINTIEIGGNEGEQVKIARIQNSIDSMDGNIPTSMHFEVTDIVLNSEVFSNRESVTLRKMGYETVNLDVSGAGLWNPETQEAQIKGLTVTGEEMGTLVVNINLGGVSRELVAKLDEVGERPETAMGFTKDLTLAGVEIDLTNNSLVDRVLEREAEKAKTDRATFVANLTSGLTMALGQLKNPEFEAKVSGALTSFLNEPKNLKLVSAPSNPVPFSQIMGTVMLAPQGLPNVLGLDISANQ